MKFQINRTSPNQRIAVPNPAKKLAGLDADTKLELHALNGTVVIAKAEMTAMDIINTFQSLSGLATDLISVLGAACGECDECGYCAFMCDTESVVLPSYVLEAAGLSPDCKLTAEVDDEGNITVNQAEYDHDLSDVPPEMLDFLRTLGVCIHKLEEKLMGGGVIYDGNGGDGDDF